MYHLRRAKPARCQFVSQLRAGKVEDAGFLFDFILCHHDTTASFLEFPAASLIVM